MDRARTCQPRWSQARWAGPAGLTRGPLISNVLTDFEVRSFILRFPFFWTHSGSLVHYCISLVDVVQSKPLWIQSFISSYH